MQDSELLNEFIQHRSEGAFSELVSRHLDLVYATALRLLRDAHLAKDLAQAVFIELARKPQTVRDPGALAGWLYRTTRFTGANMIRTEQRRRQRENQAMMLDLKDTDTEAAWHALAPCLEEAMG